MSEGNQKRYIPRDSQPMNECVREYVFKNCEFIELDISNYFTVFLFIELTR